MRRRQQSARVLLPHIQEGHGEQALHRRQGPSAEHHLAAKERFVRNEPVDHVVERDHLVSLVGEDVSVIEAGGPLAYAEPAYGRCVACHRTDAAHLEEGEVTHERTAPAAVEAEHRHEVAGRKGGRWEAVDVGPVGGVQPKIPHNPSEQVGVHVLDHAVSVLASLYVHKRRLGSTRQARDAPREGRLP